MKCWIYATLVFTLSTIATSAAQAQYSVTRGKGYVFCEAIAKALNRVTPHDQAASCVSNTLFAMKGVTQPEWREVKPEEYDLEKIRALIVSYRTGISVVMARRQDPGRAITEFGHPRPQEIDEYINSIRQGRMKLFVTRAEMVPLGPGPETILQFRTDHDGCIYAFSIYVKPDLSDFDDIAYRHTFSHGTGYLVQYFGKLHFVGESVGAVDVTMGGRGAPHCDIGPNYSKIISRRDK